MDATRAGIARAVELVDGLGAPVRRVFGGGARRAWISTALGASLFSALFWVAAAAGLGRLDAAASRQSPHFSVAVIALYFGIALVGAPLLAQSAGILLDRRTAAWRVRDAVLAFAVMGLAAAIVPSSLVAWAAPHGASLRAAVFLFGLPVLAACAGARWLIDPVLASAVARRAVITGAVLPFALLALYALGLYVAQGSGPST